MSTQKKLEKYTMRVREIKTYYIEVVAEDEDEAWEKADELYEAAYAGSKDEKQVLEAGYDETTYTIEYADEEGEEE